MTKERRLRTIINFYKEPPFSLVLLSILKVLILAVSTKNSMIQVYSLVSCLLSLDQNLSSSILLKISLFLKEEHMNVVRECSLFIRTKTKKTVCLIVLFFDTIIETGKHQNVLKCFYKEAKATE